MSSCVKILIEMVNKARKRSNKAATHRGTELGYYQAITKRIINKNEKKVCITR